LGITRDRWLAFPLDARHAAIECSNELAQVLNRGLV
jgi:hypothetical protein